MKKTIWGIVILIVIVALGIFFLKSDSSSEYISSENDTPLSETEVVNQDDSNEDQSDRVGNQKEVVIGKSIDNRDIRAYNYGSGENEILLIGGIHGGYSWNTALVAYDVMDYLSTNESSIPENLKITVIPVLNPDGLSEVVDNVDGFTKSDIKSQGSDISARFNSNDVDLNRNFDCDWQSSAKWQDKTVSGGSSAFSEPESIALKNYIENSNPDAVVVWYSSFGGVFASSCHNGISSETSKLASLYADASEYKEYQDFDFYSITGDLVNWLAKEGIPGISVILTNSNETESSRNIKAIEALINYYGE